MKDLIARLREGYMHGDSNNCLEAANAIESLAAELESMRESYGRLAAANVRADALAAKLAEIEAQEPVAVVLHHEGELIIDASLNFFDTRPIGTKLYLVPGANPDKQDVTGLVEALEALIESVAGVDQVSAINEARTALANFKGAKK